MVSRISLFQRTTLDLNLGESAEEIMRDAKRGVLFREEAALSETDCGTFWTGLLATRPVVDYYNRVDPAGKRMRKWAKRRTIKMR